MSLEYAAEHLSAAASSLASRDAPLGERLQDCWVDDVQMVWMKPCLTPELRADFKALWERYTAPSDDPHSTTLRDLTPQELATAATEVVELAVAVAIAAARADPDQPLA